MSKSMEKFGWKLNDPESLGQSMKRTYIELLEKCQGITNLLSKWVELRALATK
jgi:hypothetical protein